MGSAVVILLVGVGLIILGTAITRSYIRKTFGSLSESAISMSAGTGVVPKWASLIVLCG